MLLRNTLIKSLCAPCIQKFASVSHFSYKDPGTRKRMEIVEDLEDIDPNDLDFEANFEAFGRTHKEHVKELKDMKEKMQFDIVRQKYFRSKYPNFLTWNDKEQIRLLHRKDPEEWNIMSLSEGFPALPGIIKHIIKSSWRIDNLERIKKHDAKVEENWKKFKNNEFDNLPSDLVTHLKKFSNRRVNYQNYEKMDVPKIQYRPQLKTTEFSDIITSYEELKKPKDVPVAIESGEVNKGNKKSKSQFDVKMKDTKMKSSSEEGTFFIEPIKNTQPLTLNELKKNLQKELEKGNRVSPEDISIVELNQQDLKPQSSENSSSIDQLDYTKYNTGKLMVVDQKKSQDYNHLVYPQKINIPKKIFKKDHTYKLNDCFYDSDGTFLYRVPGI